MKENDNLFDIEIKAENGQTTQFKATPNNHTKEENKAHFLNLFKSAKLSGKITSRTNETEIFIFENGEHINRYHLRLLYGFELKDIQQFKNRENALKGFDEAKALIIKEKHNNKPYMLFLVDYETEEIIAKYEEIPAPTIKA